MSRLASVSAGTNGNTSGSSASAASANGAGSAPQSQVQSANAVPERVPYIREKLQKIITDRQGNN